MRGAFVRALRLGMTGALFLSMTMGTVVCADVAQDSGYAGPAGLVTDGVALTSSAEGTETSAEFSSTVSSDNPSGYPSETSSGDSSGYPSETSSGNPSGYSSETSSGNPSGYSSETSSGNPSESTSEIVPDDPSEIVSGIPAGLEAPDDEDGDLSQADAKKRCEMADAAMKAPVEPCRKLKKYTYLYVGASRTNRVKKSVKDSKTYFEVAPGAGSKWFGKPRNGKKPCLLTIRSYLETRPDGIVIIELGNNDVRNIDVYLYVYRKLIGAYPDAKIWFVDVLPGSGSKAKGEQKNKDRQRFNTKLHAEFPDRCLGGYNYLLRSDDFKTKDGTHYPAYVARNLYRYVMKKLGRKISYSGKNVIEA